MILEITQIIWLLTPRGTGLAKFLIDNGPEADLQWVCFLESGEVWTFGNTEVRAAENITLGRKKRGLTEAELATYPPG